MKCPFCNGVITEKEIKENSISCLKGDLKAWSLLEVAEKWQDRAEEAERLLKKIMPIIENINKNLKKGGG